jgi:predicted nucleic-acid-binding Zn-ribbon protein
MILNQDQTNKLIAIFDKKWPEPKVCPICKHDDWVIAQRVYEMREFHEGAFDTSGSIIPFIVVSCTNCGKTNFFNAIIMGIIKSQDKKEAKNE